MKLKPKNWDTFQHYKDRRPPWIRLHSTLLENREFHELSEQAAKFLILFWLLASESVEGFVEDDMTRLAWRLRFKTKDAEKCLQELIDAGFIERTDQEEVGAKSRAELNGFGTRYISDKTKAEVFARDKGKCRDCDSEKHLEYDHIIPVSRGGSSGADNLQLLCRRCNRAKRNRLLRQAQTDATPSADSPSALRTTEAEERQSTETEGEAALPLDADPLEHIPEGLTLVEYSREACTLLGIAKTLTNRVALEHGIEAIRDVEKVRDNEATRRLIQRAQGNPPANGNWTFWVNDGGWKADAGKDVYQRYQEQTQ